MAAVQFQSRDERVGEITAKADPVAVAQFGEWLKDSGDEGYTLKYMQVTETGQRDRTPTGLRITLERVGR